MFKDKRSVYIIAFSLLGLLAMQGMWVYYAIKQEKRFLDANTRQAALESLDALQQKEDSKLLITSLDTLFPFGEHEKEFSRTKKSGNKKVRSEVKVFVNNGEKKVIVHNSAGTEMTSTFAYSSTDGDEKSTVRVIKTFDSDEEPSTMTREKNKLKNYEQLLKKIIVQSQPENLKIEQRINFEDLKKNVHENLATRGIELRPEMAVTDKQDKVVFQTAGFIQEEAVKIPMFTKDIVSQGYELNLFYPSTINYIFKKAISVIVLSLFVTVLLVTVILLLYRKMLTEQKLNQYKNDFINNLTHELKTPLATIALANSNIGAAAKYSSQENIRLYTGIIDEENKKLNTHIEKVFELSLLEKEKQIFNLEWLGIDEVIQEALKQNVRQITSKNAEIKSEMHAERQFIKADKFHLVNVISNLIDNALKYNEGKPEIIIAAKNTGSSLLICVKDNGIGISKEHQRFIFDKFFRVTHRDLHAIKGFGIGLSYVKQTIELFGGTISIQSEEQKGAEFIITLPDAKSEHSIS